MSPDESDSTDVAQPLLVDEQPVDLGQALNKPTEHQRVRSGKRHLNTATPQALVRLSSADLPNASQLDLSQLNQARTPDQQASNMKYFFKMQRALAYITAAYSVMLGLTMIMFEVVCFKGDIKCELLDMSRTGRSMQIGIGAGFITHAAISFAAARNANDVEVTPNESTLAGSCVSRMTWYVRFDH
ncbi:hypothetical protein WJX79_010530 [Trebouxia sp. C0005]